MKKHIIVICFLLTALTPILNAAVNNVWEDIAIKGNLREMEARSAIQPIAVYTNGTQLLVCYNQPFGQLEVTIVDELNNQVYESNINVTTVTQEIISIGYLGKGNYTIYITNSEGKFVSGDFDIY